eukprot:754966-Alexandrium_andersonii.AAC.1
MSASLVGSEMCIRDRLPLVPAARPGPDPRRAWPLAMCSRRAPLVIFQPVSYTHLTLPTICSV